MPEPDTGGARSFRRFADMFQQMTAGFTDPRLLQDYTNWGQRSPLEALVEAVRAGLVGRRIETSAGGHPLSLTLSGIDARLDPIGAAAGQAENVELRAQQIEFAGIDLDSAAAKLGNVHTRMGRRPALVCAPIDLSLEIAGDQVGRLVERHIAWLDVCWRDSGRLRLRWKRAKWSWIDVEPAVASGQFTLRPLAFGIGRHDRRLRRAWPPWTLPLKLPINLRVLALTTLPEGLRIELRVDEWRVDYERVLGLARRGKQ